MGTSTKNTLLGMGFTSAELQAYEHIYNNGGKFTPMALQSYGYSYEESKRIAYLNKVMLGDVKINSEHDMITHVKKLTGVSRNEAKQYVYNRNLQNGYGAQNYTKEELIKHLRETAGRTQRIGIQDLSISSVTEVPRVAVVNGIIQQPYNVWNSSNYNGKDALYKVTDVTGQKVTIETFKKPKLEYRAAKVIPGVLEIKGLKQNGQVVVAFDKQYCRLCNRFIIVASLKRPEFHLGMFEIICFEGSRVYVYATNMGTRDQVKYKGGSQRVYAYGIFKQDIRGKLKGVAEGLYGHLHGVNVEYIEANSDYKIIPSEKVDSVEDDGVVF